MTAIDTAALSSRQIRGGDQPAGLAVLPDGTLLAADANDATLATVPVGGTAQFTDLIQIGRRGDSPSDLAVGPTGRVYVTLAADNAVAVLSIVGAVDRILRLRALTDYATTSGPLDDLFANSPDLTPFTAAPRARCSTRSRRCPAGHRWPIGRTGSAPSPGLTTPIRP